MFFPASLSENLIPAHVEKYVPNIEVRKLKKISDCQTRNLSIAALFHLPFCIEDIVIRDSRHSFIVTPEYSGQEKLEKYIRQ